MIYDLWETKNPKIKYEIMAPSLDEAFAEVKKINPAINGGRAREIKPRHTPHLFDYNGGGWPCECCGKWIENGLMFFYWEDSAVCVDCIENNLVEVW